MVHRGGAGDRCRLTRGGVASHACAWQAPDGPLERLGAAEVRRRIDRFAELLGLDCYRMRGWGIAKHVAWGLRGDLREDDLERARRIAQAFG